jgi:uncharacterized membrane protein YoaK (UPF0700 family)
MPVFSRQARTFRQQARLAITLSWVAGYVNVAIVALCGVTVSHVTGNVTTFGMHLTATLSGHESVMTTLFLLHLPVGFLLGAMLSQVLLRLAELNCLARPAVVSLLAEAALLATLSVSLDRFNQHGGTNGWLWVVTSLGALAMGLQNATITRISGSVVRTTHLTGVTTDFGTELVDLLIWKVRRLRTITRRRWGRVFRVIHRKHSARRVALLFAIFWSFLIGAAGGAMVVTHWPVLRLWPPTVFLLLLGGFDGFRAVRLHRRNSSARRRVLT